ncbi:MAG: hypothetical protein U0Y10_04650 [Spirosomataceae bacterium]
MYFELHFRQLRQKQAEYYQLLEQQPDEVSKRNMKLMQMISSANACGIDLVAFLSNTKAPQKQEPAFEKQQKANSLQCVECGYLANSQKALAGHQKKHRK